MLGKSVKCSIRDGVHVRCLFSSFGFEKHGSGDLCCCIDMNVPLLAILSELLLVLMDESDYYTKPDDDKRKAMRCDGKKVNRSDGVEQTDTCSSKKKV